MPVQMLHIDEKKQYFPNITAAPYLNSTDGTFPVFEIRVLFKTKTLVNFTTKNSTNYISNYR